MQGTGAGPGEEGSVTQESPTVPTKVRIPGVDYANTTPDLTPAVYTNKVLVAINKKLDRIIALLEFVTERLDRD